MIREEIISHIDSCKVARGAVQDFLSCIEFSNEDHMAEAKFRRWLDCCIDSLFYSPNKNCLVLTGSQDTGKAELLRYLCPKRSWYGEFYSMKQAQDMSHEYFIVCVGNELERYSKVKQMRSMCMNQEFIVIDEFTDKPKAEKRLASYCATVDEWPHPLAKSDFIVEIKSINFSRLNSIHRDLLWSELLHLNKTVKNESNSY